MKSYKTQKTDEEEMKTQKTDEEQMKTQKTDENTKDRRHTKHKRQWKFLLAPSKRFTDMAERGYEPPLSTLVSGDAF